MTLNDTAKLMSSDDYKDRFLAEYYQVAIRYQKLKDMVAKWDKNELSFTPTCPKHTYKEQLKAMKDYMEVLETRATMENVTIADIDVE